MVANHGGKRAGAGRPVTDNAKVAVTVRLPSWLVDWLRGQADSQAVQIERALVERNGLVPPDEA